MLQLKIGVLFQMQSIIKKANFAPNAKSPIQEGSETPSSSTSTSTAATTAQYIEIANGYRSVFCTFSAVNMASVDIDRV